MAIQASQPSNSPMGKAENTTTGPITVAANRRRMYAATLVEVAAMNAVTNEGASA